jgi:hypothetical protein
MEKARSRKRLSADVGSKNMEKKPLQLIRGGYYHIFSHQTYLPV